MIAVIFASDRLERLYTGLSLLVSAAAEGRPARGLATFAALPPLLDPDLEARALRREEPDYAPLARSVFARSLAELVATAAELEECRLWACAAAVDLTGATPDAIAARFDGVLSTPRFLREVEGAQLVAL